MLPALCLTDLTVSVVRTFHHYHSTRSDRKVLLTGFQQHDLVVLAEVHEAVDTLGELHHVLDGLGDLHGTELPHQLPRLRRTHGGHVQAKARSQRLETRALCRRTFC